MAEKKKKADFISTGQVAQNRRAHFDYVIDEVFQAGLVLTGTEVKSLRLGHANINDAYGIVEQGEVYMSNIFIAEYANKGYESHVERRNRKLLLHHKEIIKIQNAWGAVKNFMISEKPPKNVIGTVKNPACLRIKMQVKYKNKTPKI